MKNTNTYETIGTVTRIHTRSGKIILIDTDVIPLVRPFSWCIEGTGYAMTRSGGKAQKLHRLLTGAAKGEYVDHINGDPLDNRRENLRLCRKQQNEFNTKLRADNTTGYRGVSWTKNGLRYRAYITKDGRQHKLGVYDSPEDAAKAYNVAARELFGEFARLNPV